VADRPELNEIVDPPASGRVFEQELRPGLGDAAPSGRVRLDGLARWVQDIAFADVRDADVLHESAWVVRRMRIRAERFPHWDDTVRASTWCSGFGRLWAERRVRFESEHGLVDVAGVWVHLDPESRLPVPLPESFDRIYLESAQGRKVKARLKHPNPSGNEPRGDWFFRRTDADVADHVNNAAYWSPVEEVLGDPGSLDTEIEFREPAQPGTVHLLSGDRILWITAPDGRVHASVVFG
jgi:acyl-ACP thioesterase